MKSAIWSVPIVSPWRMRLVNEMRVTGSPSTLISRSFVAFVHTANVGWVCRHDGVPAARLMYTIASARLLNDEATVVGAAAVASRTVVGDETGLVTSTAGADVARG